MNKATEKIIARLLTAVIAGLSLSKFNESKRRKEGMDAVIREQNKNLSEKPK